MESVLRLFDFVFLFFGSMTTTTMKNNSKHKLHTEIKLHLNEQRVCVCNTMKIHKSLWQMLHFAAQFDSYKQNPRIPNPNKEKRTELKKNETIFFC